MELLITNQNIQTFVRKKIKVKRSILLKRIFSSFIYQKTKVNINVIDYNSLPQNVFDQAKSVFVLSTGRCGTKLLAQIMSIHKNIDAYHEAYPEMILASRIAYEMYKKNPQIQAGKLAIISSRYDLIRNSFINSKTYIETNNRLTFFAPFIAETFQKAKFIHLVRHPGAFVRSGIRRGFYTGNNPWDEGRIKPISSDIPWDKMTLIEKISWLWNETNEYIEGFKSKISQEKVLTIKAEELFKQPKTINEILEFLDLFPLPIKKVQNILKKPQNVQKAGEFPKYNKWTQDQKDQLKRFAKLAYKYGYEL